MGRELKRVPLDFDWPSGKTWSGYLPENKYNPPSGIGYQLWETTSEGSPMSPVFSTLDELCEWCEYNNASIFANDTMSKECWKAFFLRDIEIKKSLKKYE